VTAYLGWLQLRQDVTDNAGLWCQNTRTVHFGFRYRTPIDSLVIDWPSGIHQVLISPPIDTRIFVEEWAPGLDAPTVEESALAFTLHAAAPNPCRGRTLVRYDLPQPTALSLRIYDVAGRLVRELTRNPAHPAGRHGVVWDGRNTSGRVVAPGVYFVRLETGELSATRKVVQAR
jgi:hypothetical protein